MRNRLTALVEQLHIAVRIQPVAADMQIRPDLCRTAYANQRNHASVFAFFRKYGRNIDDIGFSMTLRELYAAGNDHNVKINKVLDRIPAQVDYVLRERDGFVQMPYTVAKATPCEVHFSEDRYRDDERAA